MTDKYHVVTKKRPVQRLAVSGGGHNVWSTAYTTRVVTCLQLQWCQRVCLQINETVKHGNKNRPLKPKQMTTFLKYEENGGEGGIRTHEGLAPLPVFKTGAFNRSATSPLPMGLAEM